MARALPDVAPWRAAAGSAAFTLALVALASNEGAAELRTRIGAAVVAASAAFLFDDAASVTLASSPTTLLARRSVRAVAAITLLAAWWVSAAGLAYVGTGSGWPPASAAFEAIVLLAIALGVSAVAARRSDDASGGIAGAAVAFACFATSFLPPRWWWPLTPAPASPSGIRRLVVVLTVVVMVAFVASVDPAHRRGPR